MFKKLSATGLNGLMAILLMSLLVLPITSMGLADVKTNRSSLGAFPSEVLSAQDAKESENPKCVCPELVITPEIEREIYEKVLKEMMNEEKMNTNKGVTEKVESVEENQESITQ